ncbi:hypothetical protein WJX75_007892 [Coccomyxa subellipsoidea]|uniref:ABC transporter domain-containing protein n=1 Tax=Coccomyxa subellipsoidea TaxID=248742 RepID=A0ABR2YW90_9CHLO
MTARPPIGALSEGIEICSTSQSSACKLEPSSRFFGQRLSLHRSCSRRRRPFRAQTELLVARKVTALQDVDTILRPSYGTSSLTSSSARTDDNEILIELKDVHKSFGNKKILRGVNIKIRRGETVGIIGGSGTGKSTTLRLMAGLLAPDSGEVQILGQTRKGLLADDPELAERLKVGMVFQNGALFDSLTVGENVGFMLYEHTALPHDRIEAIVAESLSAVGLSGVEQLLPSELSGGMRKRVALARAIVRDDLHANDEQVVMYDEPTAGLDPVASTVVEDLIRSMHASPTSNGAGPRSGITSYIVVTHQHSTIRRAVDRIIFLHEGLVVWEGPVEEFDSTDEPIVRQFASGSLTGPIKYE